MKNIKQPYLFVGVGVACFFAICVLSLYNKKKKRITENDNNEEKTVNDVVEIIVPVPPKCNILNSPVLESKTDYLTTNSSYSTSDTSIIDISCETKQRTHEYANKVDIECQMNINNNIISTAYPNVGVSPSNNEDVGSSDCENNIHCLPLPLKPLSFPLKSFSESEVFDKKETLEDLSSNKEESFYETIDSEQSTVNESVNNEGDLLLEEESFEKMAKENINNTNSQLEGTDQELSSLCHEEDITKSFNSEMVAEVEVGSPQDVDCLKNILTLKSDSILTLAQCESMKILLHGSLDETDHQNDETSFDRILMLIQCATNFSSNNIKLNSVGVTNMLWTAWLRNISESKNVYDNHNLIYLNHIILISNNLVNLASVSSTQDMIPQRNLSPSDEINMILQWIKEVIFLNEGQASRHIFNSPVYKLPGQKAASTDEEEDEFLLCRQRAAISCLQVFGNMALLANSSYTECFNGQNIQTTFSMLLSKSRSSSFSSSTSNTRLSGQICANENRIFSLCISILINLCCEGYGSVMLCVDVPSQMFNKIVPFLMYDNFPKLSMKWLELLCKLFEIKKEANIAGKSGSLCTELDASILQLQSHNIIMGKAIESSKDETAIEIYRKFKMSLF